MSKDWMVQKRQDHYYRMAKKQGYRARSAYKLKEINKRHSLIGKGDRVLDIGAAPGGWSQVALEIVGQEGAVVGVDVDRIEPLSGAIFIKGDITSKTVVESILSEAGQIDCVISDISPELSGHYTMDQARSVHLSLEALELARRVLRPRGNFVTKVFEGEDVDQLETAMKEAFRVLKRYHPKASRSKSSELYLIGKGFKGQKA